MTASTSASHASERSAERSLSQRASLSLAATGVRQLAGLAVSILMLPLVIRELGAERYGVWLVAQQTVGFVILGNLRSGAALKLSLAATQSDPDTDAKRGLIGAAALVWLATLPAIALIGAVTIWLLPDHLDLAEISPDEVRLLLVIVLVTVTLDRLMTFPAHVLRGMNISYATALVDAMTLPLAGALAVVIVLSGWGLSGLATATLLGMVVTNTAHYAVARRRLPWIGFARPDHRQMRHFRGMGGWIVVGDLAGLLLFGSELLLAGLLLGPGPAAIYGTTQFIIRTTTGPVIELLGSSGPGIAHLAGEGDHARLEGVRDELQALATVAMVALGAAVVVINEGFVTAWVGSEFYGGGRLTVVLVVAAIATTSFRLDAVVLDASLAIRPRATVMLACGAAGLLAGWLLAGPHGLIGLAIGTTGGRCLVLLLMPGVLTRVLRRSALATIRVTARPIAAAVVVVGTSAVAGHRFASTDWVTLVFVGAATALTAAVAQATIGLRGDHRAALRHRVIASIPSRGERPTRLKPGPGLPIGRYRAFFVRRAGRDDVADRNQDLDSRDRHP